MLNGRRGEPGIRYWHAASGIIIVQFDADDRITDKQFLSVRVSTFHQRHLRLLERLGW